MCDDVLNYLEDINIRVIKKVCSMDPFKIYEAFENMFNIIVFLHRSCQ